ncbi:MAG: NYN domain-containing protein [Nitrososphaerota archaeon]|nr:NYN domain-containing protein [Nitrososphaerota archaeon]
MIFVDGPNIYWGLKNHNQENETNLSIDYKKLIEHLANGRRLIRTTYYCSRPVPADVNHIKFTDYLRSVGVKVIEKDLKNRTDSVTGKSKKIEKGVDVALATDILSLAWENAYDTAIVASGDGDYVGAVDKIMDKGKSAEMVSFRKSLSGELKKTAMKVTYMDDIIQQIRKV